MALSGSKWGRKYSRSRMGYLWWYWGISLSNRRIWFTFWKEMDKVQANFQYQKITGNWWRRSYKCWFIWDTFCMSMWIQWARSSRNWWPLWDETRRNNLQSLWKTLRLRPFLFSLKFLHTCKQWTYQSKPGNGLFQVLDNFLSGLNLEFSSSFPGLDLVFKSGFQTWDSLHISIPVLTYFSAITDC